MRWSLMLVTLGTWLFACGCEGETSGASNSSTTGGGSSTASSSGGSSSGSGGSDGGGGGVVVPPDASLTERLTVTANEVSDGVKSGVSNWRIWGTSSLGVAPVFTVPLASCETLVGFTTGAGKALVARLDVNDTLVQTYDLGSYELRGLAAEPDGHFGALLWDDAGDAIFVGRFDLAGAPSWSLEQLTNGDNAPDDFGIGDSRLEYGVGRYGAYYHVHSDSGHEGDTLKWVDAASGAESTEWSWGCSHSMSNLLRFNPAADAFMPACVTDCYPGTSGNFSTNSIGGIYINHNDAKIIDVDAGCNGDVAGELGGAALAPNGWLVAFNAHQNPATLGQGSYAPASMNQDIGIATVSSGYVTGGVVWLTTTGDIEEADASIARWQPEGSSDEQYLVGWTENDGAGYQLARIDRQGAILEGPIEVSSSARWGRRDDPYRAHVQGDVVWAWFDEPGATTLHLARVASGQTPSCARF